MTSNRKISLALDHAHQAHLYTGHAAWMLKAIDLDGGFHHLTDDQRNDLSATFQSATRHLLRSAAILSDVAEFAATVKPYTGKKLCQCGIPAEWEKSILIATGPRRDVLLLCTQHLLESD
ncbi:MAG: hypothetical protein KBG20_22900 [Caldilineaceae bacterium]|nr:hypothetical protein [Caldilineaceae bacterium]